MQLNPDALTWLFLDMNSFFASVEQQENPAYFGKPLIVVPSLTDATCAIAASVQAKRYGIKTGTNVGEAKEKCRDIICVQARHDVYTRYHRMMLECVVKYTPITKICSIDELASKLTPLNQTAERATSLAHKIKQHICETIGPAITCSIGISSNRFLAKMAAELQKPDGLVLMPPRDAYQRLSPLRLTDLKGIGANMERRLNKSGIWTIEQLWQCSPKHLRQIWRSVEGEKFWYKLRGYDIPEAPTNTSVFGHSRVLEPRFRDPAIARSILSQLTEKACYRMRRKGYSAKKMSIGLRSVEGQKYGADISFSPPCQDNARCVRDMNKLYSRLIEACAPKRLKKVSVTFFNLVEQDAIHPDLFHDYDQTHHPVSFPHKEQEDMQNHISEHPIYPKNLYHRRFMTTDRYEDAERFDTEQSISLQQRARDQRLSQSLDKILKNYGSGSIHFGCTNKDERSSAKENYVGTKIAFNRIPDQEEFW